MRSCNGCNRSVHNRERLPPCATKRAQIGVNPCGARFEGEDAARKLDILNVAQAASRADVRRPSASKFTP